MNFYFKLLLAGMSGIIFRLTAHAQTLSIHQEQSEFYSRFGTLSEKQWDAVRQSRGERAPAGLSKESTVACQLNKRVYGWNPYWMGSAYQNYDWDLLSDLCHFSYEVDASTGNPVTTHNWLTDAAVTAAQNNGVKVSLCATLFSNHATFLNSASARQNFISTMISLVQQRSASGCNIDFEGVPLAQSTNFTSFMTDLCNQMHAAIPNSEVSIALPAVDWSNVYNVSAMSGLVDLFIIMGYDYYWAGSATAGPTDPLYNFDPGYNYTLSKSVTFYLNKGVVKSKLLLGLPYYGREWPVSAANPPASTTANGVARTYNFVRNNASGNYSAPKWDANSSSQYFAFNNGGWNHCFINSSYSMGKRFDLVNQTGIGGIGIWALGQDDGYTDFWDIIRDRFSDCGTIPCKDTIYDKGGPNRNYYDFEDYTFTIAPQGATSIQLNFLSFNTEASYDIVYLYDGPTTASPLIGSYSGTNSPGSINSSGGSLTIRHTSDNATTGPGWSAVWNCSTSPPSGLTVLQYNCPTIGVNLSWTNAGNGWFIDVSPDSTFANYWNKNVSNLTSVGCPGGFANISIPTDYLQFRPATKYFWRIWDGSNHVYGTPFITPICNTIDSSCTGTMDDPGGPSAAYGGNQDYIYTIAPLFAASVTMNFSAFDLEAGFDSLYIHDGASIASSLLGAFTGTNSPGTISSTAGPITLHFISDPFVNNAGFSATWTCLQNTGSHELSEQPGVRVEPNPMQEKATVHFNAFGNGEINMEILDLTGRTVDIKKIRSGDALLKGGLDNGIYLLRFAGPAGTVTQKLIIR